MIGRARYVLDTNVLIDAICFEESYGFRAYMLALGLGQVVVSRSTFAEFAEVLMRPKFDRVLRREERAMFLAIIRRDLTWLEPWCHYRVCRDPTDDKFINLAICAGAACIVTRDADLLSLGPLNGVTIMDARTFVQSQAI